MAIIKWRDSYNTGVEQFDDEHQKIVELINTMFEVVRDKSDKEITEKVCREMLTYTEYHFSNEEQAMESVSYPHLEEHVAEHNRLKEKVQEFQLITDDDFSKNASELYRFLREWLLDHIMVVDKKYSTFLKDKL